MPRKSKTRLLPQNWPTDRPITYLTTSTRSQHLTPYQLTFLRSAPPPNAYIESPSHIPPVQILLITDPTHPANTQHGLFAYRDLPPRTFIAFYHGHIHNELDNNPQSDYDLSLDRDAGLAIDATHAGNEARFVNDYRGVPGREQRGPNAEFEDCWVQVDVGSKKGWERRVGVYVLPVRNAGKRKDGIKKGEEILVSYGKGFWCKSAG